YIILPIVIFMDFFFVSEVPLWKCILYILPMAVFLISLTYLFTLCYLALVVIFYIFMFGLMVLGAKGRGHRRVNSFGRYFTLIYIFLEYIVLFQAILFGLEPAIAETVILMLTLPEVMCFDFKLFGKVNVKKAVFCLLPIVFVLLIYFYILHIYV
ncbi:MAG: hypothetical protein LUD77_03410, partial [Clostridiales bacterium]|nr:hypothetical protein [Clostridiales bacterium]